MTIYSRTSPVQAPENPMGKTVQQIDEALRDFVLQDTAHLRREAEDVTRGGLRPENAAQVVTDVHSLVQQVAGVSLDQLDDVIVDLRNLRDFLHREGVRVQREISGFLQLNQAAYPVGSALSVHRDSDQRTGSFTFYIHPRWNLHWGGDLHVFPGSSAIADEFLLRNDDEDEQWPARQENSETDDAGISISIPPKPNRLVLIASNRPHRIARVDQNAGTAVRASVAGFFLRHTLV